MVMAWSVDRLGRSLQDLIGSCPNCTRWVSTCPASAGARYDDASGKAMFQMMGVFAEFSAL